MSLGHQRAVGYTSPLDGPADRFFSTLHSHAAELVLGGCLLFLTLAIYWPVRHYDFVDLDDPASVPFNEHVMAGLTGASLRWAFISTEDANWIPLTRISLMADRQFFGPSENVPPEQVVAGPYHWTNVWIHAASTVLLFGILRWVTGGLWTSALAAFLFGLHPQHVESVAWVTERKDVLSAFFWLLAIWSYIGYARHRTKAAYLRTLALYGLGFMAKPMVITLPVVFVLLDIWPLRRLRLTPDDSGNSLLSMVREKTPFWVMALAMAAVTIAVQHSGGAVRTVEEVPWGIRMEDALISPAAYILQMLWPAGLAIFYPIRATQPVWNWIAAAVLLVGITAASFRFLRTRPYLVVGWLWYLVALLPVLGIIQVGSQMRADRYTYIPAIGLSLMAVWGGAELLQHWPRWRLLAAVACGTACVAFTIVTARQVSYWQNSRTLYEHAIAVTENNALAHARLGKYWEQQGMTNDAISEYRQSLEISPRVAGLQANLGDLLFHQQRPAEAIRPLQQAVALQPDDASFRNLLGSALAAAGRGDEAVAQFEAAIRLRPDYAEAQIRLGNVLKNLGRTSEAQEHYAKGLRIQQTPQESPGRF